MRHVKHFYSALYKRHSTKNEKECLEYLNGFSLPKLKDIEREVCEGLITRKERWDALNAMKNGKSPGNDGLTKEFYDCFFNQICSSLIGALNYSFEVGQLSTSQRQALITIIEKKDKDKRYIKIWRPISLINVNAKIASKALAARVKKVLASIIKSDQTVYVEGRYIGESIRLISDILEYTEDHGIDSVLFSADFEKAFDSIEHPFILASLEPFGFGPRFLQWIRVIPNNGESCIMNKGHSTGYFPIKRGCGQGDPLSACLFIICVEVLFVQVRDNNEIIGITINDHEIKLSAFADDANFLVSNIKSLELVFNACSGFQTFSSLKLNLEKSEACWIGAARASTYTPISCKCVNLNSNVIRPLGIFNSYDTDLAEKLNFLDNLKCLTDVLNLWRGRDLSFEGKILVFKSLALSKLFYSCTMKVPSKQLIEQLNIIHKNLVWNNKRPKHSTLIVSYSEGGYNDIDINTELSSIKLSWVTRLMDENFHPWKVIPSKIQAKYSLYFTLTHSCLCVVERMSIKFLVFIEIWFTCGKALLV